MRGVGAAIVLVSVLMIAPRPDVRAQTAAAPIRLDLPIRCRLGETCVVQQYFDHDPGPGAADYRCGPMVYDGHDGTDFRVPSVADQKRGVDVLAAAAGKVRSVRDGMIDQDVRIAGAASVRDRECGNGVLVTHPDGWETQYCHMARGSVRVRPGQTVVAGQALGLVGESGDAAFPHVHLSVRHGGVKVDPFAWAEPSGPCGGGRSLWSAEAARALAYRSPDLLNAGFAPRALTSAEVEAGEPLGPVEASSAALVVYVRLIGLKAGDDPQLMLSGPNGEVLARTAAQPMPSNRAEQYLMVGKRLSSGRWPAGRYEGRLEVRRAGAPVLTRQFSISIS
jgi:hypothetical protein